MSSPPAAGDGDGRGPEDSGTPSAGFEWRSRRERPAEQRRRSARAAWYQIAFLLLVLVVLLLSMTQIGERSAGCFAQLTDPGAATPERSQPTPTRPDAPSHPPATPAPR